MEGFQLISAYVVNFGILQDFSYSFSEGINVIEEENGWGKSTFAAFLKAMFFGMEYSRATKTVSERKRYEPYLGKGYGGNVVFSYNGGTYRVERSFGKTDKDDTFQVTDLSTNLSTNQFGDSLGEQIWKVDRESYEKTSFITLEESEFLCDIISQKLGDIKDQEADIEQSSNAKKVIDKAMTEIKTKRGKTGLYWESVERIRVLEENRRESVSALANAQRLEKDIHEYQDKDEALRKKLEEYDTQLQALSLVGKKTHYESLQKSLNEAKKQQEEQVAFFKDDVPSKEQLDKVEQAVTRCNLQAEHMKEYVVTKEEQLEVQKILPTEAELDSYHKKIMVLGEQKAQLNLYKEQQGENDLYEKLKAKYGHLDCTTEMVDAYLAQYEVVSSLKHEKEKISIALEEIEPTEEKNTSSSKMVFIVMAIICIVVGVFFPPLFIAGIVCIIGAIVSANKSKEKNKELLEKQQARSDLEQELATIEENIAAEEKEYIEFLSNVGASTTELPKSLYGVRTDLHDFARFKQDLNKNTEQSQELSEKTQEIELALTQFFEQYGLERGVNTDSHLIQQLREKLAGQKRLLQKQKQYEEARRQYVEASCEFKPFLAYYFGEILEESASMYVKKLQEGMTKLDACNTQLKQQQEAFEEFKRENNIELLTKEIAVTMTLEEIQTLRKELEEQRKGNMQQLTNAKKDCEQMQQKGELLEDIESQLEQEKNTQQELTKRYELLQCAFESLEDAKEALASRYKAGTEKGLQKYLSKIDTSDFESYEIDIKLNILHNEAGSMREASSLSKGKLDLVRICLRMALVEAVYKDVENPILIMDDPFVNLDGKRLEAALDLLKEIGKEYQVIYFVCHASRNGQ